MSGVFEQPVTIRLWYYHLGRVQRCDKQLRPVGHRRRAELHVCGVSYVGRLAQLDAGHEDWYQELRDVADGCDESTWILLLDMEGRQLVHHG